MPHQVVAGACLHFSLAPLFRERGRPSGPWPYPMQPCGHPKCHAVMSPYELVPNAGAEVRLVLTMVRSVQDLTGGFVDILLFAEGANGGCSTTECVQRTANALHVHVDWERARVFVVSKRDFDVLVGGVAPSYRVFTIFGHDQMPPVHALGDMSLYVRCEIDTEELMVSSSSTESHGSLHALSSYDAVLSESHHAAEAYRRSVAPALAKLKQAGWLQPHVLAFPLPLALTDETVFDRQLRNLLQNHEISFFWRPLAKVLEAGHTVLPGHSPYAACIVEMRTSITFPLVVRLNMKMLRLSGQPWRLYVYHGTENADFVRSSLQGIAGVVFLNLEQDNLNDSTYNQLLKSQAFWKTMTTDGVQRVLIFQLDGLLVRPGVGEFLAFDYVGAPWTKRNDAYVGINEAGVQIPKLSPKLRVGNGGLSLRNPTAMLDIIRRYAATSTHHEQEDVFFVRYLHQCGYEIADLTAAARFAVEVPLPEYDVSHVFSIHQSWWYIPHNRDNAGYREVLARLLSSALLAVADPRATNLTSLGAPGAGGRGQASWSAMLSGGKGREYRESMSGGIPTDPLGAKDPAGDGSAVA
mmetsp:Transcript_61596/g.169330  ORF Transcript_61596/g.169330 Transcript_61596/m.169330 type:complete len:580 (-) Transcript_61596:48-1787(-)